ncbi:hypothetical protein HPQ61_00170 [Acetobacteraceae bacterium]|nr:hypothetical protein [Acetobacteraceae bacterium]
MLLLAGMVGKAEHALRGGVVIRVPITGYDPRDPLRGHFLGYRIVWNWLGGQPPAETAALCVTSRASNPPVRPLPLLGDPSCLLMVRLAPGPYRSFMPVGISDELFIPEERADSLQSALRSGGAAMTIDLAVSKDGTARLVTWHIDGRTIAEWDSRAAH